MLHREAYDMVNQVLAETGDDYGVARENASHVISPLDALLDDYREATNTPMP